MKNKEHLFCKDEDGNQYELVDMNHIDTTGQNHACNGCSFLVRGRCRTIKTCTPKDQETGERLVKSGCGWKKIETNE